MGPAELGARSSPFRSRPERGGAGVPAGEGAWGHRGGAWEGILSREGASLSGSGRGCSVLRRGGGAPGPGSVAEGLKDGTPGGAEAEGRPCPGEALRRLSRDPGS